MSAIDIAIAKLVATPGVTNITTPARIYPIVVPQTAEAPFIVVNIVTGRDDLLLAGAGQYYLGRVSVDCCAATASAAVALGNAVMAALQDVVKESIGAYTDVDIYFATTDMTDVADDRSMCRRLLHFYVRWRTA